MGRRSASNAVMRSVLVAHRDAESFTGIGIDDGEWHCVYEAQAGHFCIAMGQYTNVYVGELLHSSGWSKTVVVKQFRGSFEGDPELGALLRLRLREHTHGLLTLDHPNITKMLFCDVDGFPIVLREYYPHDNIIGFLKRRNDLPMRYKLNVIKELIEAVAFLHSVGYVHGNIHGGNVMIDVNNDNRPVICDSGINTVIRNITASTCIPGRYRHTPPELIGSSENNAQPTTAGDVFSLGRTCQEILTLRSPFHEIKDENQFILQVIRGGLEERRPNEISIPVWDILKDFVAVRSQDRPSAADASQRFATALDHSPGPPDLSEASIDLQLEPEGEMDTA